MCDMYLGILQHMLEGQRIAFISSTVMYDFESTIVMHHTHVCLHVTGERKMGMMAQNL